MTFLKIALASFCLMACQTNPPPNPLTPEQNLRKNFAYLFGRIEKMFHRPIEFEGGDLPVSDSLDIPADADFEQQKRLLDDYLKVHGAVLTAEGERIVIKDRRPFDALWTDDGEKALALSKKEGRPLFVYLTSDGCGYCRDFEEQSFVSEDIREELSRYVLVKILLGGIDDEKVAAEKVKNKKFLETIGLQKVNGFPTFKIVQGKKSKFMEGYFPEKHAEFVETLKSF